MRLDAGALQMRERFVELALLARGDRHFRAHLAERFGDLQPEAARAAGDEGVSSLEREQLADIHGRQC